MSERYVRARQQLRRGVPRICEDERDVAQQLTPLVSGFVSVDNLTNNDAHEFLNNAPVTGRTTTVGVRIQY